MYLPISLLFGFCLECKFPFEIGLPEQLFWPSTLFDSEKKINGRSSALARNLNICCVIVLS
jgi:hypothetical protein